MHEQRPQVRRFPRELRTLTGLRAIAVGLVIGFHLTVNGTPLLRSGFLGVNLFFVVSGFLITALLVGSINDHGLRYGNFLARRALRLMPALFVMVAVVMATLIFTGSADLVHDSAAAAPFALTYTSNVAMLTVLPNLGIFSHTWSLALEEQFYIAWPLLLAFLIRRTSRRVTFATTAILAVGFALVRVAAVISGRNGLSIQADALLIGCLAGLWFCWSGKAAAERLPRPGVLAVGWILAAAVIVFVGHQTTFLSVIGSPLFAVLVAFTLLRLSLAPTASLAGQVLASQPIWYLGRISYGLYLWHLPVIVVLRDEGVSDVVALVIGPIIALVIASMSYHLLERPFLVLKDRLSARDDRLVEAPL